MGGGGLLSVNEHIPSCGLPPKDLEFTASSEEWDKSKECTLSLQETAHHGLGLREFHTSRGYSVWGQHSHSLGVKLTPQLDRENVCVCVCEHVHVSICVYTQLCFFNDTYSHFPYKKTS